MNSSHAPPQSEVQILARMPLFSDLDELELAGLAARMERRVYRAGEVIYHRRDVATGLFVITKGEVKTRIVLPDDRKLTFQLHRAGGFFGMNSLLSDTDRFTDAVAVSATDTLFLPRDDFFALLEGHPAAMQVLLRVVASMYLIATEKIHDLAFLDIPGRIAKSLLRLAQARDSLPASPLCVSISQTELASLVGATRESTNKSLHFFEHEGWIELERGLIRILQPDELRRRFQS